MAEYRFNGGEALAPYHSPAQLAFPIETSEASTSRDRSVLGSVLMDADEELHRVSSPQVTSTPKEEQMRAPGSRLRAKGGDEKELYSILLRAVRKAIPSWLAGSTEDLAQKCVLRLLEREERLRENGSYCASYLFQIANSVVLNEMRSHRRRGERLSLADSPEFESHSPSRGSEQDPEKNLQAGELQASLSECLKRLSSERRTVMLLRMQGYSTKEVAKHLGWEVKRTQNLFSRGRIELRMCLSSKGQPA